LNKRKIRGVVNYLVYWKEFIAKSIRVQNNGLYFILFYFFHFHFHLIILHFSIFRTMGLGLEVISHTVTPVTSNGMIITLIMELKKRE